MDVISARRKHILKTSSGTLIKKKKKIKKKSSCTKGPKVLGPAWALTFGEMGKVSESSINVRRKKKFRNFSRRKKLYNFYFILFIIFYIFHENYIKTFLK